MNSNLDGTLPGVSTKHVNVMTILISKLRAQGGEVIKSLGTAKDLKSSPSFSLPMHLNS